MNQRRLVWKALKDAGILESNDPRLQELVTWVRDSPDLCWADFVSEYRERFYDTFDTVIAAFEASDDPLIRNTLIRYADPNRPKERQMLTKMAEDTDFERDALAAERLSSHHVAEVDEQIQRRAPGASGATSAPSRSRRGTSTRRTRRTSS